MRLMMRSARGSVRSASARRWRGGGAAGVDSALGEGQGDKFLLETGSGKGAVDALVKGTLLAVVNRAIKARKCWTKGGLIGEGDHRLSLDRVL